MSSPDLVVIEDSDVGVQLFVAGDIYRFDIDNRPLRVLIANDQALQTGANLVIEEVYDARTNTVPFSYTNLKDRLDDMDVLSGYAAKVNLFGEAMARAARYRAQFGSGFFCKTGEVYDGNLIENSNPNFNDFNLPYGAICVPTHPASNPATTLSSFIADQLEISTQAFIHSPVVNVPIDTMLAGFPVRLFNESANGAGASHFSGGVSIKFNAASGSGQRFDLAFLEFWFADVDKGLANTGSTDSFYEYGAVDSNAARSVDQSSLKVAGSVWFNPANSNFIQLRHRIRVVDGVDYLNHPMGMSDSTVTAQGGQGAPVGGKVFTNGAKSSLINDPAVWVAGDGSGGDQTALATVDGHVYGVPVLIISRKNTAAWSLTNQNGGTGRPDGYTHQYYAKGDIIDLRPQAFTDRQDLNELAEETFDRIVRGKLRTVLGQLQYQTGTDVATFTDAQSVYGSELLEVNYIEDGVPTLHVNTIRDFDDDGVIEGQSKPIGFRRLFAPTRDDQVQGFSINIAGVSTDPADFCLWSGTGSRIITLKAAGNSANGPANAHIKETPFLMWRGSKAPVSLSTPWTGIGTNTATAIVNDGDSFYSASDIIDGAATISWPGSTAIRHAPNRIAYQDYRNPSSVTVPTIRTRGMANPIGLFADSAGKTYVCDTNHHRVVRYSAAGVAEAQFPGGVGSFPGSGSDNAHLNQPQAITVDGSGNVYVADTNNHRVIKLSSTMVYINQFGDGTPGDGSSTTRLNFPQGVAVDAAGIYISDTSSFRVVKLNLALAYVSQFGTGDTSASTTTTCVQPLRCMVGGDGKLYVADAVRVLILNPSTMALQVILTGGQGLAEGASISALNAIKSLSIVEDGSGNKYVAGGATSAVYKFDSSFNLLAKFGSGTNNLTDGTLWYGPSDPNKNIHCARPYSIVLDDANNSVWVADNTFNVSPSYSRVLVLNTSDLTFKHEFLVGNPRPWVNGSVGLPFAGPYPSFAIDISLDTSDRKMYIATGVLAAVEKWSVPGDDPSAWTFNAKFGGGSVDASAPFGYRGWRNSQDNTTRMSLPETVQVSRDGNYIFVGDRSIPAALAGHYAARVLKIDTATMGIGGANFFGDLTVADIGTSYPGLPFLQWVTGIVSLDGGGIDRVYVSDAGANPPNLVILDYTVGWNGTGSGGSLISTGVVTDSSWKSVRVPAGANENNFLAVNGYDKDSQLLYICPGFSTQRWAIDNGLFAGSSPDNPERIFIDISTSYTQPIQFPANFLFVSDVWQDNSSSRLLISDQAANVIYAVSTPSYFPLGEAGTPGVASFVGGGWSRPSGVAINTVSGTDYLYLIDLFNGALIKTSPYYAYVERGTGRVECLLAPPAGSIKRLYSNYTPYQGVYQKKDFLGNAAHVFVNSGVGIFGSRVLYRAPKILSTTLGRVGVEIGQLAGNTAYASPLSHLPLPAGTNTEYEWQGTQMQFAGDVIEPTSFVTLPVLSTTAQPLSYEDDCESGFDPDTRVANPANALTKGGYSSWFAFNSLVGSNEFPILRSFSLSTPQNHIVYHWGIVDYCGEMLLFIRGDLLLGTNQNVAGPPITRFVQLNDVIELFRMNGNPFCKFTGSL